MKMHDSDKAHDVVLVGGGPSAVAALGALLKEGEPRSITILDRSEIGIGRVFGPHCAGDPALLCNSCAGVTYVDDDDPSEFVKFLAACGWPATSDDYTPRFVFGEFVRHRYLELADRARHRGIPLVQIRARATTIRGDGDGYALNLDTGAVLRATDVLLCVGMERPTVPPLVADHLDHPRLLHGTYPVSRLRNLPAASHVLVLGLRSSGLDAAQVLSAAGHSAVLTSPSGRVSAVRDRLRIPPRTSLNTDRWLALDPDDPEVEAKARELLAASLATVGEGLSVAEQIVAPAAAPARLRDEIELAESERTKWSDLAFDAILLLNQLVGGWDDEARRRLLPGLYEILSRYVNALPLLIAQRLLESIDDEQVTISPVFLETLRLSGKGWTVAWADGRAEAFDAVIVATGYDFPRFTCHGPDGFEITNAGALSPDDELVRMSDRLRLDWASGRFERVWALGPATNQRFPLAHIIFLAAKHAAVIAPQVFDRVEADVTAAGPRAFAEPMGVGR